MPCLALSLTVMITTLLGRQPSWIFSPGILSFLHDGVKIWTSNLRTPASAPISRDTTVTFHQGRVAQLVERSLSILRCMRKVLGSIPSSSKARGNTSSETLFLVVEKKLSF